VEVATLRPFLAGILKLIRRRQTLNIHYSIENRQSKMEPTIGIEPMNLFLTKEALYRLSYVGNILRLPFANPVLKIK
jgi:hypothetical protein